MALTKESVVDQITIMENGTVQLRRSDRILEDGSIHSQTYHRIAIEQNVSMDRPDVASFFAPCSASDISRVKNIMNAAK